MEYTSISFSGIRVGEFARSQLKTGHGSAQMLKAGHGSRSIFFRMAVINNNNDDDDPAVRVMFAAGGTGGHVFPAIAIADALTASQTSVTVQFVGTKHRVESSAVPRAGYPFRHIPAAALRRPVFLSIQNLLLPFHLMVSVYMALRLLLDFRPHVVVGTGGYVSWPICIAAALCGSPFVIQEQNAYPGMANKILAKFATTVFVGFEAALAYFPPRKCIVYGNPIRSTLQNLLPKTTGLCHFFPNWNTISADNESAQNDAQCEVILIQGGSLGAKSINQAVSGFVTQMLDKCPQRFVIWQTGSKHFKEVMDKIGYHERLFISEFLNDMKLAYSATDLVVASAGAITCSELLVLGKPSILIPLKYVVDDHQSKNAISLQKAGASKVLQDSDLTPGKLEAAIDELLGDKLTMSRMCESALKAAAPDAADLIAKQVFLLARNHALRKVPRGLYHLWKFV